MYRRPLQPEGRDGSLMVGGLGVETGAIGRDKLRHFDFDHDCWVANLCMPGPVYNWFCVAHTVVDVLSNAAAIRASQIYPRTASATVQRNLKRRTAQPLNLNDAQDGKLGSFVSKSPLNALYETGDTHISGSKVLALTFGTHLVL